MVIANILGFFLFFYLYWKKLKDDYSSEKIFNSLLLADWTAFYLSKIYSTEPDKVAIVEEFKKLI